MSGLHEHAARRRWLRWFLLLAFLGLWAAASPAALGEVVRVEEDWELVIGDPDPNSASPQVTCTISPVGDSAWLYAAFELNQCSLPAFQPGGMQLQVWQWESPQVEKTGPAAGLLASPGETIRWTQNMHVNDGVLVFEVTGGSSTTWGDFGGSGSLKVVAPMHLYSLDYYSPDASVAKSGVGYAANRVERLVLKRVRYFSSTGEQWEDNTERVVHSAGD